MNRRACAAVISLSMLVSMVIPASAVERAEKEEMVYLGVQDYGVVTKDDKESFQHRFYVDGEEGSYKILPDNSIYAIQNRLQEGYLYEVTVENGIITEAEPTEGDAAGVLTEVDADHNTISVDHKSFVLGEDAEILRITAQAGGSSVQEMTESDLKKGDTVRLLLDETGLVQRVYLTFVAKDYTAPVRGEAGRRTLKNFLATALEPVGTALYIYGGTWDWQDVGSSNQATTIGLSQSWVDFFQSQNADYTYKNEGDHSQSYYPHEAWNQYYYAGIDCSGYVGWAVYNLMNTTSGNKGYVQSATGMAKSFAETQGWGTWTQSFEQEDFKPGDIFSMNGHVWICLGVCQDGSLVILHSTPSQSVNGQPGGGVQINGVGDSEDCQAVQLAREYMSKYYPQWYNRYHDVYKNYTDYTEFTGEKAGKFSWSIGDEGTLTDPEGYANMTADEILKDLFGESPAEPEKTQFQDVPQSAWYYDAVQKACDKGIMSGVSADRFAPYELVTRGMIGQILYAQEGRPAVSGSGTLVDVPKDAWFASSMAWAKEHGVLGGYPDGRMGPSDPVTRQQLALILYRHAQMRGMDTTKRGDLSSYTDLDIVAPWAREAMEWAVGNGLISGRGDTLLAPNGSATRAESAQIMTKLLLQ